MENLQECFEWCFTGLKSYKMFTKIQKFHRIPWNIWYPPIICKILILEYWQFSLIVSKWSNNSDVTSNCWIITHFSFLLTAAIFDLVCFYRASSLVFLLLLSFLFTQGYFISSRVEIFSTQDEMFHIIAIFFNSVYRVEISTCVEYLHIVGPLIKASTVN